MLRPEGFATVQIPQKRSTGNYEVYVPLTVAVFFARVHATCVAEEQMVVAGVEVLGVSEKAAFYSMNISVDGAYATCTSQL
jgi:hypothetical protein